MIKYICALALALSITGCASMTVPPTVKIPVAIACSTEDPVMPTYRFNPPYSTLFDGARDLMGDRELALAYELELRAALKSCK